jgi:hypothetical protein
MRSTGKVGIGTWSPAYKLEVETTGENCQVVTDRTDGATSILSATSTYGFIGTMSNHSVRFTVNDSWRMQLNASQPYITMSDGGNYDGDWNSSSSRELKENIFELSSSEALKTLEGLTPVKFNYKAHKEELHVGFIAEDVPELVAHKTRKSMSSMDVVAVLTRVMQQQQETIKKLEKKVSQLEKKLETK